MGKTNSKQNNLDVIELEATEENQLDKTITGELVRHNVTDQVIAGLKEKYGELRLSDINDKEGYLEIKDAKKEVRKWGILTEKLCKKGREDAIAIQRKWLAKEKEVLGKIDEVERPLQEEINRFEVNIERIENEQRQRIEDNAIRRQAELSKMGARYENGSFILDDVSFEATLIKESDDDVWQNSILAKYKIRYEKNEAIRIEEEKKRTEAAESLRIAQEEMARKEKEMAQREAAFKQAEDERLAGIRRDAEEADKKRRDQLEQRRKQRSNELQSLGMTFNFNDNSYVFRDVNVHNSEITLKNEDEWSSLIEQITPLIEDRKADLEVKRQEEIKQREKEAGERAVAAEQERQRKLAEQIEIDKKRAEAAKAEELAKASDRDKWRSFLDQINKIDFPPMKHISYTTKIESAKSMISKINNL